MNEELERKADCRAEFFQRFRRSPSPGRQPCSSKQVSSSCRSGNTPAIPIPPKEHTLKYDFR
ncbi:hypothetical protein ACK11Z_13530 [Methanoculleus bourgensis]|uniref:hypothetical protein n=1 Tax=Methanoculleus bourgensis TaxID=83986 RepID=UPI000A5C772F